MSQNPNRPTLRQAACLLLASAGLGLASNALNPAGLRWSETNHGSRFDRENSTSTPEIYRNEALYKNETISGGLPPRSSETVDGADYSTTARVTSVDTTPLRSTWAEVKPLIESGRMVLVDARPRNAFDAGHIPGAVCLPFNNLQAEIRAFMAVHPSSTPLAIYCANANCGTSSQLAAALTHTYKYENVRYLPGGYQEWRNVERK